MSDDFDFDHFFDDLKSSLDDDSPFVEVEPRQEEAPTPPPQEPRKAPARETTPRKRETPPAPSKQPKKPSKRDTVVGYIAIIVIILVIVLALKSCGGKKEKAPPEETPIVEILTTDIIEDYDNEIVVMSKIMLDDYIYDYEISLAPQKWTIAMFDDQGAVIANTNVGRNGVYEPFVCVFTPVFENNEMTAGRKHYLSVGNDIFVNDGYCDDVFSKIASMAGGPGE